MKTFIDISSDKVVIYGPEESYFLERNGVDEKLGPVLVECDRKRGITDVVVLNGPGGFTNLRVGTLALNLLKTLKGDSITFYTISKPELYKMFYERGRISRYGILYIGQKTNVRLWDIQNQKLVAMIKKNEIQDGKYGEYKDLFFDNVYDATYFGDEKTISYSFKNEELTVNYNETIGWSDLAVNKVDKLQANYMIEPNVS